MGLFLSATMWPLNPQALGSSGQWALPFNIKEYTSQEEINES